uniref:Uncharacterized protein n=1 Tax=Romanomermis culicivorax TaxID=13658 RepID=A0A915K9Z5_ROMCU
MPPEEQESYDAQEGTMSDSAMVNSIASAKSTAAFNAEAKRKKSLMTRLIPGRGNAANSAQDQKRLGFRRSDEVGIPSTLSPQSSTDLVKQTSKESTDSNDSTSQEVGVSAPVVGRHYRPPLLDQANNDSSIGSTTSEESSSGACVAFTKLHSSACLEAILEEHHTLLAALHLRRPIWHPYLWIFVPQICMILHRTGS